MELDKGQHAFLEEAHELVVELESTLLELESNPEQSELLQKVFRIMHTIKGSGGMFGFENIVRFTHELEHAYDLIRKGELNVDLDIINLTLQAHDHILHMLHVAEGSESYNVSETQSILNKLSDYVSLSTSPAEPDTTPSPVSGNITDAATYHIRFHPFPEFLINGSNPTSLLEELREMGTVSINAHTDLIPDLSDCEPHHCFLYWDVVLTTTQEINSIKDVFIFVEDECELKIDLIDDPPIADEVEVSYKKLGEILIDRGDATKSQIDEVLDSIEPLGKRLVKTGNFQQETVDSALSEQKHVKKIQEKQKKQQAASTIRVPAEKLDRLMDLLSELITVQANISQVAHEREDPELENLAEITERVTTDLREIAMGVRMLAIGTTFSKFKRLVRDLSQGLGKKVALKTEGSETELDKKMLEKLSDPLVHILRNALDHGIESPEERVRSGKSEEGTITLRALYSGTHVVIEVSDDGRGLNPQAIYEKAKKQGLINPEHEMDDSEIQSLIFAPGFSTALEVTDISGRGVGMDVVKQNIESLRGSIDLQSTLGFGTTLTINLPLTLAIIDGLLVQIAKRPFIFALASVIEISPLDSKLKKTDQDLADVRGELVPFIRLNDWFELSSEPVENPKMLICLIGEKKVGFVVDHVVGEHQTVIKPLGKFYQNVKGLSGTTILADGSLALILDVNQIYHEFI